MTRYAQGTNVPIAKTRGEIERLLRAWGCDGIRWTDHYRAGLVVLEFLWAHEGQDYLARFRLALPSAAELEERARTTPSGQERSAGARQSALERLRGEIGKQEHRVLLLWLKAALNAVDAGIVEARTLFLPFLVGRDGRTVAEVAAPRMPELLGAGAASMLALPEGGS